MPEQLSIQVGLVLLARQARHFLVDLDGLGFLTDQQEGLSQQAERIQILGIGLEADLQLGQRGHAVIARGLAQVQLGCHAREAWIGIEMQDALDDLERVVAALQVEQELGRRPERLDGLVEGLDATAGFGQA